MNAQASSPIISIAGVWKFFGSLTSLRGVNLDIGGTPFAPLV